MMAVEPSCGPMVTGGEMTVRGVWFRRRKTIAAAVLVAGGVLLTGCSGASDSTAGASNPAPTTTVQPTTTSVPSPGPPVVKDLVLDSASIELRDVSGEAVATFDYAQPASEVLPALSAALGGTPISGTWGDERHPYLSYTWGDLVLRDYDRDNWPGELNCPNSSFQVSAEAVNGVRISTVDDIAVGDNAAELDAQYPNSSRLTSGPEGEELRFSLDEVDVPFCSSAGGSGWTASVILVAEDPLGPITYFTTPSVDSGA